MIRIEVISTTVKQVASKKTGEIFNIPEVTAYAHGLDKYPQAIKFSVGKDQPHPQPGFYELAGESLYVGKFGALSVKSSLALKPISETPGLKRAA